MQDNSICRIGIYKVHSLENNGFICYFGFGEEYNLLYIFRKSKKEGLPFRFF